MTSGFAISRLGPAVPRGGAGRQGSTNAYLALHFVTVVVDVEVNGWSPIFPSEEALLCGRSGPR